MIAPTAAAVAALEPEIAALAAQKATEQDKEEIVRLCDEVENFYRAGKNHTKNTGIILEKRLTLRLWYGKV